MARLCVFERSLCVVNELRALLVLGIRFVVVVLDFLHILAVAEPGRLEVRACACACAEYVQCKCSVYEW